MPRPLLSLNDQLVTWKGNCFLIVICELVLVSIAFYLLVVYVTALYKV